MSFTRFPKISAFKGIRKYVRRHATKINNALAGELVEAEDDYLTLSAPLPIIEYEGTVKLHGTNAGVRFDKDGKLQIQSRNRLVTPQNDNAGFAAFCQDQMTLEEWHAIFRHQCMFNSKYDGTSPGDPEPLDFFGLTLFGEWCGGNIQKSVAICELPKMFVIFGALYGNRLENSYSNGWEPLSQTADWPKGIYSIWPFKKYKVTIDFGSNTGAAEYMQEVTLAVDEECPVASELGIKGTGEGIVWKPVDANLARNENLWFKTKGTSHTEHKVCQNPIEVDHDEISRVEEFIRCFVTEARLLKGIDYLKEMNYEISKKSTGPLIKWVVNDLFEEEGDEMSDRKLNRKILQGLSSKFTRIWYFGYIDQLED